MRVALYARVSTEEQARHGLSIDTQLDNLRQWASQNNHTIVAEYVDGGVSGKKPYNKRPALSRFINDLENGITVDALVFCQLDRFFRSVKHYYQIVSVMDKYHVGWQAIQEDYETLTSAGRFKVNIMLSVAEAEADRTSERIKIVMAHKAMKGEALTGVVPLGYEIVNHKLMPNGEAPMIQDLFNYYEKTGSKHAVKTYLLSQYGISRTYKNVERILSRRLYTGEYRDNLDFCEPIISKEQFERVQKMIDKRSVRHNQSGRTYLFTGLLVCSCCGRRMTSAHNGSNGRDYYYYRCPDAVLKHTCINHKVVAEEEMEQWLLTHLPLEYDKYKATISEEQPKKVNTAAIKKKMERLKDLYVDGVIGKEEFHAKYDDYKAMLEPVAERTRLNTGKMAKVIGSDYKALYAQISKPDKAAFWRSIIDRIELDESGNRTVIFR